MCWLETMLFLSDREQREWRAYADEILRDSPAPGIYDARVRHNLVPAFHFYIATFLAAHGRGEPAVAWVESAVLEEEDGIFGCAYLLGFLKRYNNELKKPATVFADPRPFIHFTTVPLMNNARRQFVRHCAQTLPVFDRPIRFMDIGCGDGALTVAVLTNLLETKRIPGIAEVLLVDPSPAMAALAEKTIRAAFPSVAIGIECCRIQECSGRVDHKVDIAMSSLAYHHMPVEDKRLHLRTVKPWIDHFLLFEMDADIDRPERLSPALALAVYQSYGRFFDCIYAHDAPVEVVNECIDMFLMTEVVSILTEPRGERSDYHMLRTQWIELLNEVLGPEFSLMCESSCHADEHLSLIALHYGRTG
ncbi:MAG: class I SAM-dependent methyltransferase [Methanoregula sp.]|jgi:ubiquinone/menaquinone biosynthesis C-methylase UbiE|nr:class I SAM-dependent methyltransferase [Methanoregula sp.]